MTTLTKVGKKDFDLEILKYKKESYVYQETGFFHPGSKIASRRTYFSESVGLMGEVIMVDGKTSFFILKG